MEDGLRHITARFPEDGMAFPALSWRDMPVFDRDTAAGIADYFRSHPEYFPGEFTQFHPDERVFEQFDANGAVIERYTPIGDLAEAGEYYAIGCVSDWEWDVGEDLGGSCGCDLEER